MDTRVYANVDLMRQAFLSYGQTEYYGQTSNPWILQMIQRWIPWASDDSAIAWCSIWMNDVAKAASAEHTSSASARSWLDVGVPIDMPEPGDVVILWRESKTSWKGHVGLFVSEVGDVINILGGNQGNAVSIKGYRRSRLLGYRRLRYTTDGELA